MEFLKLDAFLDDMPLRGIPASELILTKDGETVYHRCAQLTYECLS